MSIAAFFARAQVSYACVFALGFALLPARFARAGNSTETTWIPLLPLEDLAPKKQTRRIALPRDARGIVRVPLFMTGRCRPPPPELVNGPLSQMMVGVDISIGGKRMSPWAVTDKTTGFVLSLATIDANPAAAEGAVELEFDVKIVGAMAPSGIEINIVGCPDLLISGDNRDGSFDAFVDSLPPGITHDYFEAMRLHLHGDLEPAQAYFSSLASCGDERIARFARRNMRVLRYQQRPPTPGDDDITRRAGTMYLQAIGQFGMAYTEGMYGGRGGRQVSEHWFRMAELADRMSWPIERVAADAEAAGRNANVGNPVEWHQLLVVLGDAASDGATQPANDDATRKRVTLEQVEQAYVNWHIVSQLVYGASGGMLTIRTEYAWIKDTTVVPYAMHEGRVFGPADSAFATRGMFDGVTSVRPDGADVTVGADSGPNGAALSDLPIDASVETMLKAWRRQFDWAVAACEPGPGFAAVEEAAACGVRPSPSTGFGLRAALQHYMTPMMYRGVQIAVPPCDDGFLRLWSVEGAGFESPTNLIDLTSMLSGRADAPASMPQTARLSCWVFSPVQQFVAAWLGFSDRISLHVNGAQVRRGDYRPAGKWVGKPIPDMVMSHAMLMPGWNKVEAEVSGGATGKTWAFSMRLANWNNEPLTGMATRLSDPPEDERAATARSPSATTSAPATWAHHSWDDVAADYHDSLPVLSDGDLAAITGVRGLRASGELPVGDAAGGYVAFSVPQRPASARYRPLSSSWSATDRDTELNNLLDWSREDVAAFAYQRGGSWRALLLLRPETATTYLTLLAEAPAEAGQMPASRPTERIVGYVKLPLGRWSRTLLVADVSLGDPAQWPIDEEDLLLMPVSKMKPAPPATQPKSDFEP